MIAYILYPSCFCEILAFSVSRITYDYLYHAPCLACWALFSSLVPTMYKRTSCPQVHELPESHCGDNREDTLFSWLHIYTYIYIYIYMYIYIIYYIYYILYIYIIYIYNVSYVIYIIYTYISYLKQTAMLYLRETKP